MMTAPRFGAQQMEGASYLVICSGRTGERLESFAIDQLQSPLVRAADLDGNGKAEILLQDSNSANSAASFVAVYLNGRANLEHLRAADPVLPALSADRATQSVDAVFASDDDFHPASFELSL